jgi:hypothetical protein
LAAGVRHGVDIVLRVRKGVVKQAGERRLRHRTLQGGVQKLRQNRNIVQNPILDPPAQPSSSRYNYSATDGAVAHVCLVRSRVPSPAAAAARQGALLSWSEHRHLRTAAAQQQGREFCCLNLKRNRFKSPISVDV